jgi:hypothetical protein
MSLCTPCYAESIYDVLNICKTVKRSSGIAKAQKMAKMLGSGRKHENLHTTSLTCIFSKMIKIQMILPKDLDNIRGQTRSPLTCPLELILFP